MIRELSPELAKIAKNELNENPKQIKGDLQQIADWIGKQSHLKARTDDQWLVALLRSCKFSIERVKKKLELYYTLRITAADITQKLKPTEPEFLQFLRKGTCLILPAAKSGIHPRVILIRAGAFDPQEHSAADLMCILYYLVQILVMEDDVATVVGTKIVVDYEGCTVSHLAQATPSMLKKMIAISQSSLPLRLKGSHHINVPMGIEVIFSLVSGFLSDKVKQRLKVHKSVDELVDVLPKEIIPVEYGGSGSTLPAITEYWAAKVVEYKSWMKKEEQLGVDESKRLKWDTAENEVDGSFRKLDID